MAVTNYAKATYREIIDLETTPGITNIIGIHTPVGVEPYTKMRGFFSQFRKYRYKGCRISFVPASNLPIDPLGLTGVPGTTDLMDPRDALNPILFHGCHGESLAVALNNIYSSNFYLNGNENTYYGNQQVETSTSLEEQKIPSTTSFIERTYYACLTDPKWKKYGIQSSFTIRGLHPLTWVLNTSRPIVPAVNPSTAGAKPWASESEGRAPLYPDLMNYSTDNSPLRDISDSGLTGPSEQFLVPNNDGKGWYAYKNASGSTVIGQSDLQQDMFTGRVARLGWLPTYTMVPGATTQTIAQLPRLYMGVLILPPAYNVTQFFRCAITHYFEFRDFTTSLSGMDVIRPSEPLGYSGHPKHSYFNWIDYGDAKQSIEKDSSSIAVTEGNSLDVTGDLRTVSDNVL